MPKVHTPEPQTRTGRLGSGGRRQLRLRPWRSSEASARASPCRSELRRSCCWSSATRTDSCTRLRRWSTPSRCRPIWFTRSSTRRASSWPPPSADTPPRRAEILARLRAGARDVGATPIGVGLHPSAQPGDAEMLSDDERYRYIAFVRRAARQTSPTGERESRARRSYGSCGLRQWAVQSSGDGLSLASSVDGDSDGAPAPVASYEPTGQWSTASPAIGKSFGFPVARRPPMDSAAAATRQSACANVRPLAA